VTSPLFTLDETAEYLRTTERHVRRLVEERRLPFVKVGKFVRIRRVDCDAFIEAGLVVGSEWRPTVVKIQRRGRAS
jgi:excisionase family DNA binding protein